MASPLDIARNASEASPEWIQPGDALARVEAALGDRTIAISTLLGRLRLGLLQAMFEEYGWENVTNPPKMSSHVIEPQYWSHYERGHEASYFWKTGDLRLWVGGTFSRTMSETSGVLTFFRVKIGRKGIEEITANAPTPVSKRSGWITKSKPPEPPPPPPQKTAGGRPRKEWWDDFWIEICGRIYEGDLKPKTQAELQEAMHEWVENHRNGEVGETTIKAAARKLFQAWKLGSKT